MALPEESSEATSSNQTVEVVHTFCGRAEPTGRFFERTARGEGLKIQTILRKEGIYINDNPTRLIKGPLGLQKKLLSLLLQIWLFWAKTTCRGQYFTLEVSLDGVLCMCFVGL